MRRRFHLHLPGLLFVALTLVVGFAAANRPNNLVVWAFGALLSFILVSGIISGSMMIRLRIKRLETRRAVVGQPFEIRYNLTNTSRIRSAFAVRINEIITNGSHASDFLTGGAAPGWSIRIAPGETQVCDVVLWPSRRGAMNLDRVRMTSFFPFGLVGRSVEIELPKSILVLPRVHKVRADLLRQAVQGELGGIRLSRTPGSGEDFYSVREFRPGDSVRQIAWKRLGSSDELLVVQRSSSAPPRLHVYLDLSTPPSELRFDSGLEMTPEELEERAIMMAASVIAEADQLGHEYGLSIAGLPSRTVPMRRGYWHRERLMATLAEIDLKSPRQAMSAGFASNDERSAIIMIHPGRIDTRRSPDRAWHWSATRMSDLIDLDESPLERDSDQTDPITNPRVVVA
jgi:uncharacterized protein (DUF58 family)